MDGLVTAILSGVIVALVGAIAAYYFGVRQQRLNRGADALDRMRPQIALLASTYSSWVDEFAKLLVTGSPPTHEETIQIEKEKGFFAVLARPLTTDYNSQTVLKSAQLILDKKAEIAGLVESLRAMYWEQRPSLPDKTRNIFESFVDELQRHHSALSDVAEEFIPTVKRAAEQWRKQYRHRYYFFTLVNLPNYFYHWLRKEGANAEMAERIQLWQEAVKSAQDWDAWQYVAAFDAEADRLRRNTPV